MAGRYNPKDKAGARGRASGAKRFQSPKSPKSPSKPGPSHTKPRRPKGITSLLGYTRQRGK